MQQEKRPWIIERERSVDGKVHRQKSYADILKTDGNTAGKFEKKQERRSS